MTLHRTLAKWMCALALLAGSASLAMPGGTLVITDHALDPSSPSFEKDAKSAKKASLAKTGESWHLFFVAWLKKSPGAGEVNIVFYEPGKKENLNAYPIATQPSAKILMSDIEINGDQGFKAGKTYDVRITRLVGGHEEVFARANLKLE